MVDRPVQELRQDWLSSGIAFLVLLGIAVAVTLLRPEGAQTGILIGIAALGILIFKLGELAIIAIGELRRRREHLD